VENRKGLWGNQRTRSDKTFADVELAHHRTSFQQCTRSDKTFADVELAHHRTSFQQFGESQRAAYKVFECSI
jgi:hypothetical protein